MRYVSLGLLISTVIALCIWQQLKDSGEIVVVRDTGVKWDDSLFAHLPKQLDTSIILTDAIGNRMPFREYIKPVFNHEAVIFHDKGTWKLHRFTASAMDSLSKDDYAVAKRSRFEWFRAADTIQSWKVKLDHIAEILNQTEEVLVLKSKRLMLFKRKGIIVKTLKIDLGFTPVGDKIANKDGKTPEGIYHLDEKYVREDKFYKSIHISYPTKEQRALAKSKGIDPGFGISIHGTPAAKVKSKDWTAGCIALQNDDIDTLFKYVPEGAVIEIRK